MTPDLRQSIVHARTGEYSTIMRTTLFTFTGIAAIVHLGPDALSLPLLLLTVSITAFGVLAGSTALDDINNLKADMTPEFEQTSYGAGVVARDVPKLKLISAVLISLSGLALILAILF